MHRGSSFQQARARVSGAKVSSNGQTKEMLASPTHYHLGLASHIKASLLSGMNLNHVSQAVRMSQSSGEHLD